MDKIKIRPIRDTAQETSEDAKRRKFRLNNPLLSRRAMERLHTSIERIMEKKQFADIDEANAYLNELIKDGKIPEAPARTKLEEAQDLLYSAWEEPSRTKRVRMARRALEISDDCADAYVLLAEETAEGPGEEKILYEKGVQAGERAIGPLGFRDHFGHFWGVIETRPYMRARAGLAGCLWRLGEQAEAIRHFQEMLKLNPNDNQGVRYTLLNYLIEEDRIREAKDLLDRFQGEISASWLYTKALLKFKREESNPKVDARLMKALEYNRFVPLYLLGVRKLPRQMSPTIGMGDEDEAIEYVSGALRIWYRTPGALKWLACVSESFIDFPNNP